MRRSLGAPGKPCSGEDEQTAWPQSGRDWLGYRGDSANTENPAAALPRPEDSCPGVPLVGGVLVCFPASQCVLLRADDKAEKGDEKDSAVVTQSDEAPAEEDHLGPNCYYDKSKSFFDNISSELKTRSGGRVRALGPGLVRPG